jgi:hypothetical protein
MTEEGNGTEYDYQQLRIPQYLREVLKEYRNQKDGVNTLSEAIIDILPSDNPEVNKMEMSEDEFVLISVDRDAHSMVHDLAGENITSYTVIERFFRETAEEEGFDDLAKTVDNRQTE